MGAQPPFIYDKASSYTFAGPVSRGFDPKAATRASWTPKVQKQKQDGPLINFNKHPDTYYQSPYGNINFVPMHPDTRKRVKRVWRTQRYLRILALLAALGAVFCISVIRKTTTHAAWIIRVGPCVAVVHTLYAIRFHFRDINKRPPASNASYQVFAALVDTGLLAFFGLTCYMATMDYMHNTYQWDTVFAKSVADYRVIFAFMILTGTEGGLHLFSLALDIWLALTYKKISNLPPDMNPLEDKSALTGDGRKHKRSKSELVYEKHLSTSTMSTQRFSQMTEPDVNARRIPFKHTRTDSADSDTLAYRNSTLSELKDPYGAKDRQSRDISRPSSAVMPAANARAAGAGLEHKPARSSGLARNVVSPQPATWLSYSNYEGAPAHLSDYAQYQLAESIRTMSPVSALNDEDLRRANSRPQTPQQNRPYSEQYTPQPQQFSTPQAYLDQENFPSPTRSLAPPAYTPPKKRSREPLGMNPPTPVNPIFDTPTEFDDADLVPRPLSTSTSIPAAQPSTPQRPALHEAENAVYATPSSRPASFVGSGTKSRFYGNLRNSLAGSPTRESRVFSFEESDVHRSDTVKTAESANFEVYASDSDDEEYDPYRHAPPVVVEVVPKSSPERAWGQRQISNSTGNDLVNGYAGLDPEFGRGMARRREVSGKAAEEGRAFEITTPTASPAATRPGAAGWARFKGL